MGVDAVFFVEKDDGNWDDHGLCRWHVFKDFVEEGKVYAWHELELILFERSALDFWRGYLDGIISNYGVNIDVKVFMCGDIDEKKYLEKAKKQNK